MSRRHPCSWLLAIELADLGCLTTVACSSVIVGCAALALAYAPTLTPLLCLTAPSQACR